MSVRAVVIGVTPPHHVLLRYVLDGTLAMRGPGHIEFHNLAPGRHRLVVMLSGSRSVKSTSSFTVRRPPPAPAPAPAPVPQAPPPPVPAPAAAPPPPPSNPIPQHNGGDQDSDNNGGPSDGDGNL